MRLRQLNLPQPAWAILAAALMLFAIGLLCIYATEAGRPGPAFKTTKQSINLLVGVVAFLVVVSTGYTWFKRFAPLIVAVAVIGLVPLVLARFVSFGGLIPERRGAHRWIQLPFYNIQPSEPMKVAYVVGLAAYLRYRRNFRTFRGLMIPLGASMVPLVLILLEPDLGTALLIMPVLFVMLFAAGARTKHLLGLAAVGLCMVPVLWLQLQPYQRSRVLGMLLQSDDLRQQIIDEPDSYSFLGTAQQAREWEVASGMQLVRSKAALGSGGLTGHGWGEGVFVEFSFLPDKHNDFIFAMVGHQWGLIGCLVVLICYTIMVLAGIEIAANTMDPFARLLAVGVVALLAVQVMVNIGMTIGLLPITGMTLPFVSYGGSSLLTNFIGLGLLVSVSRHRPYLLADRPFEFGVGRRRDDPVKPIPDFQGHA